MTIPYSSTWNGSFSNYSVQLWIKLGTVQDYRGALAVGSWNSPFNIWFYADGSADFRMDSTSGICSLYTYANTVPLDNAFHQLSMTFDAGLGQVNAYIDGVVVPYPRACSGPLVDPVHDGREHTGIDDGERLQQCDHRERNDDGEGDCLCQRVHGQRRCLGYLHNHASNSDPNLQPGGGDVQLGADGDD